MKKGKENNNTAGAKNNSRKTMKKVKSQHNTHSNTRGPMKKKGGSRKNRIEGRMTQGSPDYIKGLIDVESKVGKS